MNPFSFLRPKVFENSAIITRSPFRNRLCGVAVGIIALIAMAVPAAARAHRLNHDEMTVLKRVSTNSGQQRDFVKLDPILCIVARKRAADMAKRDYFSHTNPNGQAANFLVSRAGYVLPAYYDKARSANNIESIAMSAGRPQEVVSLWLKSSGHRPHILGELEFYRQQSSVGVGVYRSSRAPYYQYYVFLSAPPNAAPHPRTAVLKNPKGGIIASTRPLDNALAPFTGMSDR